MHVMSSDVESRVAVLKTTTCSKNMNTGKKRLPFPRLNQREMRGRRKGAMVRC